MNILRLFKKEIVSYAELSIGKVGIKPLRNGALNNIKSVSTIAKDIINENLFYQLMEYELTDLSLRQIKGLSVSDGKKLRAAIKDVLKRYDLRINFEPLIEKEANIFSQSEVEWFEKTKSKQYNNLGIQ